MNYQLAHLVLIGVVAVVVEFAGSVTAWAQEQGPPDVVIGPPTPRSVEASFTG